MRLPRSSFIFILMMLANATSPADENSEHVLKEQLSKVTLDVFRCDAEPLSEAIKKLEQQTTAKMQRRISFAVDLELAAEEPKVSCRLAGESVEAALDFITQSCGFEWSGEETNARIFTNNVYQAKWKLGLQFPERETLRKVMLPRLEFHERSLAEIFDALGKAAFAKGLNKLRDDQAAAEFVPKFEESTQAAKITIIFDECSVDDALELLTIRAPFQWTIVRGAIVGMTKIGD